MCIFFSCLICRRWNGTLCTYFHIAAGQVSHFGGISLFHNTNLKRNKTIRGKSRHSWCLWSMFGWTRNKANLNGSTPANNESGVVFPAQTARVHVGPQAHIVPQHICDPLFCAEVIYFNSLKVNSSILRVKLWISNDGGCAVAEILPHCWPMQSG